MDHGVYIHTHTHTHNRFTALLEYVRDHPGEQVPERKKSGRLKSIWIYWSKGSTGDRQIKTF